MVFQYNTYKLYWLFTVRNKKDMDHEDAVKVLKDAQGNVSVVNHTTLRHVMVGTLKMVVKYSPRGMYICTVVFCGM